MVKILPKLGPLFCNFPGAERPAYLVPKAVTLLVVMEGLDIDQLHWRPAVGSCAGILVDSSGEWDEDS